MREILFRGKHKNGFWCYGNLNINSQGVTIITPDETALGKYGPVIPETVGQYTGLTDKNGKKIFEGDILKEDKHRILFVVEGTTTFGFDVRLIEEDEDDVYWTFFDVGINDDDTALPTSKIIGNIHDNPEWFIGE